MNKNMNSEDQDKILADYHEQVAANKALSPEERAKLLEDEEDEYFEQMQQAFMAQERPDEDDDIEYFANHPLNCAKLTPEVLERPEFEAL